MLKHRLIPVITAHTHIYCMYPDTHILQAPTGYDDIIRRHLEASSQPGSMLTGSSLLQLQMA